MAEARQLSIRIEPELRAALEERAAKEGITVSALIRRTLKVITGQVAPEDLQKAADQLAALQGKKNKRRKR